MNIWIYHSEDAEGKFNRMDYKYVGSTFLPDSELEEILIWFEKGSKVQCCNGRSKTPEVIDYSMRVGDVIEFSSNGKIQCYYVTESGFGELDHFTWSPKYYAVTMKYDELSTGIFSVGRTKKEAMDNAEKKGIKLTKKHEIIEIDEECFYSSQE